MSDFNKLISDKNTNGEVFDNDFIANIFVKAIILSKINPEESFRFARQTARGICSLLYAREIGDPSNKKIDELIEILLRIEKIPENIKAQFLIFQKYGHSNVPLQTDNGTINRYATELFISALIQVNNWYFLDYLATGIPAAVANAVNEYEPFVSEMPPTAIPEIGPEGLAKDLGLPSTLRPYQWEGVNFLTRNQAALLADEMGLGKTVQTIVALKLLTRGAISTRVLVITPNALAYNWEREFSNWAPELVVRRVMGGSEDRLATYLLPIQILIATYDQVRTDVLDMDAGIHFDVVVLDEAQRIKNRHSRTALACRLLRWSKAWILTGTPLENSVDDLVSLFIFLSPGLIDSGMSPKEVHRRIKPYFLRRRKKDVLKEIPPIIIQDVLLELSGAQESAYNDLWASRREQVHQADMPIAGTHLFALITRLKQLCNYEPISEESVKLEALSSLLEECTLPEDKVIVFSQYVETLRFISQHLGSIPQDYFTGEQAQDERDDALTRFKELPGPRVLLISLSAGGVGLNIQEASIVVLFDRWWNPAVESQAIQRAHRFGRERPLHVVRFLVSNTIEERIRDVLQKKDIDFERYIENAVSAPVMMFTRQELRRILELTVIDTDNGQMSNNLE
jgi:SNF2 family DNA or RNA helicase